MNNSIIQQNTDSNVNQTKLTELNKKFRNKLQKLSPNKNLYQPPTPPDDQSYFNQFLEPLNRNTFSHQNIVVKTPDSEDTNNNGLNVTNIKNSKFHYDKQEQSLGNTNTSIIYNQNSYRTQYDNKKQSLSPNMRPKNLILKKNINRSLSPTFVNNPQKNLQLQHNLKKNTQRLEINNIELNKIMERLCPGISQAVIQTQKIKNKQQQVQIDGFVTKSERDQLNLDFSNSQENNHQLFKDFILSGKEFNARKQSTAFTELYQKYIICSEIKVLRFLEEILGYKITKQQKISGEITYKSITSSLVNYIQGLLSSIDVQQQNFYNNIKENVVKQTELEQKLQNYKLKLSNLQFQNQKQSVILRQNQSFIQQQQDSPLQSLNLLQQQLQQQQKLQQQNNLGSHQNLSERGSLKSIPYTQNQLMSQSQKKSLLFYNVQKPQQKSFSPNKIINLKKINNKDDKINSKCSISSSNSSSQNDESYIQNVKIKKSLPSVKVPLKLANQSSKENQWVDNQQNQQNNINKQNSLTQAIRESQLIQD